MKAIDLVGGIGFAVIAFVMVEAWRLEGPPPYPISVLIAALIGLCGVGSVVLTTSLFVRK
jgi:hypothetical protein